MSVIAAMVAAAMVLAGINGAPHGAAKVSANGFTVPIAQGVAGGYEYVVGVWPPSLNVGELFMSISLSSDQQPVTDTVVDVAATVDGGPVVVGPEPATNSILHLQSYELSMTLSAPGRWLFKIDIESPIGVEVVEVPLEITANEGATNGGGGDAPDQAEAGREADGPQARGNGTDWAIIAASAAFVAVAVSAWIFKRQRRRDRNPEKRRRR